jgi:hypothetical protein
MPGRDFSQLFPIVAAVGVDAVNLAPSGKVRAIQKTDNPKNSGCRVAVACDIVGLLHFGAAG